MVNVSKNLSPATLDAESLSALDFSGEVVLVTGGGKGVGRGISESFLRHGAEVVICGRKAPETLPQSGDRKAHFIAADVRDNEQIDKCLKFVLAEYKRLDVLVNNVGGSPSVDAATASPRLTEAIIRLNLIAPIIFAQAANQVMQEQPTGGRIINIASVSAARPSPRTAAYGAAKAGLVNACASLAIEWAPKVRINAIISGLVATPMALDHYGGEAGVARVAETIPLKRMATPHDIGTNCLYLASPLANYVSGVAITVHGGGEIPAFLTAVENGK